jgi:adenosine deaminase
MANPLTAEAIRSAPKVLLHDHLDGGLRPATVLDLAGQTGYRGLPADDPQALAEWFRAAADSGSLERYLETFVHTVGVMQTADSLVRVAAECAADLAADGVVYAEVRFAPELHVERELTLQDVVEAVLDGFRQGAEAADFTIHAGEAFGLPSIWQALQWCGADRLGHGVRIIDDISVPDGGDPDGITLGRLAAYVRDKRIPLELCPSSNVQTGAVKSIAAHPIGLLRKLYFRVTVNTDNRLMSNCTMSSEMTGLVDAFGYGWSDLRWLTVNAMKSSFLPFDERLAMINDVIKPGYATLLD